MFDEYVEKEGMPLKHYAAECLKDLKEKGYKLGLASSTSIDRVRPQLTDTGLIGYFDDIVGVTNYKNSRIETVVLKVSNKSIDYIRTKPLHRTQSDLKELNTEGQTFIQLKLKINTELEMLLLSYGDAIEIVEPSWLRASFTEVTKKMSDNYKV